MDLMHLVNKILKFPHTWMPKVSLASGVFCVYVETQNHTGLQSRSYAVFA